MGPLSLDIDGIQRLAGRHKQAIAFWTTEADVAANLRQEDLTDALSVGSEDVHAIVAFANPTEATPNVAVNISANAVGATGKTTIFHLLFRGDKLAPVANLLPVHYVPHSDVFGRASVAKVEFFVIR